MLSVEQHCKQSSCSVSSPSTFWKCSHELHDGATNPRFLHRKSFGSCSAVTHDKLESESKSEIESSWRIITLEYIYLFVIGRDRDENLNF
jgi:hypothetical protein